MITNPILIILAIFIKFMIIYNILIMLFGKSRKRNRSKVRGI